MFKEQRVWKARLAHRSANKKTAEIILLSDFIIHIIFYSGIVHS